MRVRAGAFGPAAPSRDLWLSPDHAVYARNVLIPIRSLINGTSIAQMPLEEVVYYHVELPRHGVLLAEGLSVESYLDTGDRTNFTNDGPVTRLFSGFSPPMTARHGASDVKGCAPLVLGGPHLRSILRDLDARAAAREHGAGNILDWAIQ